MRYFAKFRMKDGDHYFGITPGDVEPVQFVETMGAQGMEVIHLFEAPPKDAPQRHQETHVAHTSH